VRQMSDEDRKQSAKRTGEGLRDVAILSGAGFTLAASVALGALGGNWLDHKLGTAPWLLVVGLLLGAVAGFGQFLRLISMTGKR
jgi:ATP synthase protein I